MRFTHTADCHIGGHRDPKLRRLTEEAFERFVDGTLQEQVDFCLIAGDLFDSALPGIDALKTAVQQLSRLREAGIPVYVIPGSHDYSPSGKTVLAVLEEAGLLVNVFKGEEKDGTFHLEFTKDPKTGALLTGILGKRGMLDKALYENLQIPDAEGEKIFLFHTALEGMVPEHMPAQSQQLLPDGFQYYAGGHVHIVQSHERNGAQIVYPGPLFPNSFSELEELEHGGYFLRDGGLERRDIALKSVVKIHVSVEGRSAEEANELLRKETGRAVADAIVLLRIEGKLSAGSPADLDIRGAVHEMKDAYAILRNTAKLTSTEFAPQQRELEGDIEYQILQEHADQLRLEGTDGLALAKQMLQTLSREPREGEKRYEYEASVVKEGVELLQTPLNNKLPPDQT